MTKIDIFSGFLGAGKTTLIKKLIAEAYSGEKLVLIENEFGEINIDGGFLKESGIEISEMSAGCICCSLVGDFNKALKEVVAQFHPDRILIEPSGVGKLSDVIVAVERTVDECLGELKLNSYVTVADASKVKVYMKNFGEFYNNQIEAAGTIILSRTQKLSQEKLEAAAAMLREKNPDAAILTTPWDELDGKTMGIVGYGAIGSAVGAVAQALGMKLLVTARHEKPVPEGARFVSLPELLAQSDVVSLHCPQTAENARMIDAGALAQMKDGAILLNTARGGLLDEQAVADALRSGKLLAAGMDVVSAEPIRADNPLLTAPNCFLTPHIAWAPLETRRRLQAISAENLRAFLSGKPQNVVNP